MFGQKNNGFLVPHQQNSAFPNLDHTYTKYPAASKPWQALKAIPAIHALHYERIVVAGRPLRYTASESRRVLSVARVHMLAITGQRQANAASCSKRCKMMQFAMLARVSHRTAASRMQIARHASGR